MTVPDDFLPEEPQEVREEAHSVALRAGTFDADDDVLVAAGEIIASLREDLARASLREYLARLNDIIRRRERDEWR